MIRVPRFAASRCAASRSRVDSVPLRVAGARRVRRPRLRALVGLDRDAVRARACAPGRRSPRRRAARQRLHVRVDVDRPPAPPRRSRRVHREAQRRQRGDRADRVDRGADQLRERGVDRDRLQRVGRRAVAVDPAPEPARLDVQVVARLEPDVRVVEVAEAVLLRVDRRHHREIRPGAAGAVAEQRVEPEAARRRCRRRRPSRPSRSRTPARAARAGQRLSSRRGRRRSRPGRGGSPPRASRTPRSRRRRWERSCSGRRCRRPGRAPRGSLSAGASASAATDSQTDSHPSSFGP